MSENKRYYWYKMKSDFFEEIVIKFLIKQKKGEKMILLFQQIMLYSLKTDGYIHYRKMLPSIEEQIGLAIGAKPGIIRELLDILINFEVVEKIDDNTYFIKMLEDCVGSETDSAQKMRKRREIEKSQCDNNVTQCSPEKDTEKETDTEKELYQEKRRTSSSFSEEKKGGRYGQKSNFYNNSYYGKNKPPKKPASYDMEAVLKENEMQELTYIRKNSSS